MVAELPRRLLIESYKVTKLQLAICVVGASIYGLMKYLQWLSGVTHCLVNFTSPEAEGTVFSMQLV